MKKVVIAVLILCILCSFAWAEGGEELACQHAYQWWPTADLTETQYAACSLCGDEIAFCVGGQAAAPQDMTTPCSHAFCLAEEAEEVSLPIGDLTVHGNFAVYPCACTICGEAVTVYQMKSITTHDIRLLMEESRHAESEEKHHIPCVCMTCGHVSEVSVYCRLQQDGSCGMIGK